MAYTLKAEGANSYNLTDETVVKLHYSNSSAADTDARARDTYQSIEVEGRIRSDAGEAVKDETINMAKWSLVAAKLPTAYQSITAKATAAGQTTRQYEFPEAFVVAYSEEFSDQAGVGSFSVTLRQKKDMQDQVKISGGYAAE